MRQLILHEGGLARPLGINELADIMSIPYQTADTVAGAVTLGTDNFGFATLYYRSGQTAAVVDVLPTGVQMETDLGVDWPVGVAKRSYWTNNGAFTQTLSAGAGFTIIGPAVIFPAGYAEVLVTHTALNTWTWSILNQDAGPFQGQIFKTTNATVGAATVTAAELRGDVRTRTGPVGAYADTLPLGTAMEADPVFAAMTAGQSRLILLANEVAFIGTWTAAAGFTLAGNAAAQPASSCYKALITKTAVNVYVLEILG